MRVSAALPVACAALLLAAPVRGEDNSACEGCHAAGEMGSPKVDFKAFAGSIHGKHLCVSCHADAAEVPHPRLKPVSCKTCHRIEAQIYMSSDHGSAVAKGMSEAAACKDCHGHSHTLLNSRDPKSPVSRKNIPGTCARCHDDPKRMATHQLAESHPITSYSLTIHGHAFEAGMTDAATCTDCHGSHDLHGAANSASRIFWRNVPETCGRCHANVLTVYRESIHGRAVRAGIKESPVCTSCHGEHTIRSPKDPGAPASSGALTKTCTGCHASERLALKFGLPVDRLKTYMDTYHGLAGQRGDLKVANCGSCHGFHDVLPHTDPRSSVYKDNLAQTCGKCHKGAGAQLSKGFIHAPPVDKHFALKFAAWFYLMVIPMTLGGMFAHNALDFLRKLIGGAPHAHAAARIRMTLNERLQHAINAAAFIMLAYTGFALKYADAWWAWPMSFLDEDARRHAHRWAALAFCILGLYHVGYMLLTRRGRVALYLLFPRLRDAKDVLRQSLYFAGLRQRPPLLLRPFNYIEKSEYWALLWGSAVMIVSGALLVFSGFTLRHFPMWVPELATLVHFYEAILACAAIAVWHLYAVIFDPSVYPMNWTWLTGFPQRKTPPPDEDDE